MGLFRRGEQLRKLRTGDIKSEQPKGSKMCSACGDRRVSATATTCYACSLNTGD